MILNKYLKESAKYLLRCPLVIRRYINEVERLYAMSPEELRTRNEKRFLEIFNLAYDKSPFYHRLYTEAGINKDDIQSLNDIQKLPVITKDMVRQHADKMLTVPRRKVIAANTSGTTGTPLRVYEDWPSIWRTQAYTYCSRKKNGFTYGQRLVSLRGNLDKRDLSLKVHFSNTLYLSSYNINQPNILSYYNKIREFKPTAIEGYPSSLYALSIALRDAGLKLNIPITFTSSETLLGYQRKIIESQLETEIFDRYSMTERTIYLIESNSHNGYYEAPGFSINEYVSDGEICTSLINDSFPLIRYKSNDVMELHENGDDKPPVKVKSIIGRMDDIIFCKDGSRVSRIDFIEDGKNIKACQWIQHRKGELEIRIVPDKGFTEEDRIFVVRETEKRVGKDNLDIESHLVDLDDLIYSRRGKFKLIINEDPNS